VHKIKGHVINSQGNNSTGPFSIDTSHSTAIVQGPEGDLWHLDSEAFGLQPQYVMECNSLLSQACFFQKNFHYITIIYPVFSLRLKSLL
jgi:hypothetical protein